LHNDEIHYYYCSSQNIIREIKSRKMRWAGHVARMIKKSACRVLVRKRDNEPLVVYIDVNMRLVLKDVLKKGDGNELDLFVSGYN
jgi:hypothetical protein